MKSDVPHESYFSALNLLLARLVGTAQSRQYAGLPGNDHFLLEALGDCYRGMSSLVAPADCSDAHQGFLRSLGKEIDILRRVRPWARPVDARSDEMEALVSCLADAGEAFALLQRLAMVHGEELVVDDSTVTVVLL
jgi:hypothetical protein